MERHGKVIELRHKILRELQAILLEFPFDKFDSDCLDNANQKYRVKMLYALLKLKQYADNISSFEQYTYNSIGDKQYILMESTIDVMLDPEFNFTSHYLCSLEWDALKNDYVGMNPDITLTDRYFEFNMIPTVEKLVFERKIKSSEAV